MEPAGLENTTGFECYVNSCLQVMKCILQSLQIQDGYVNDSLVEGDLTKILFNNDLIYLKKRLAQYDSFFSCKYEESVFICFKKIFNILHKGTERNSRSLTNMFCLEKSFKCRCNSSSEMSYFIVIEPGPIESSNSINDLLRIKFNSELFNRKCSFCNSKIEVYLKQTPKVLIIIINRSSLEFINGKNTTKILMDQFLILKNLRYELKCAVYHHGTTPTSGHFTCRVSYPSGTYICDDKDVAKTDKMSGVSDEVLILFYCQQ